MDINLSSVGTVRSTRHEPTDDFWDMEEVYLELTCLLYTSDAADE